MCNRIESVTHHFTFESLTDDLTGWYNRKGFTGALETEVNRAKRYNEHLSVCLMGVDLKVADLKMSYEIKDRNLRMIGKTLSKLIRKCDSLGRLDAETFALLMPETTAMQAASVCNRLRSLLMEKRMDVDGMLVEVVLSIVELDNPSDETAMTLLAKSEKKFADMIK